MNKFQTIKVLILVWLCPIFIKAQTEKCQVVDKSLPSQYLKYVTKKENDLIYQFVNNFTCSVIVEIEDQVVQKLNHKQNGTFIIERSTPQSGDELRVHYYFLTVKNVIHSTLLTLPIRLVQ